MPYLFEIITVDLIMDRNVGFVLFNILCNQSRALMDLNLVWEVMKFVLDMLDLEWLKLLVKEMLQI